MSPRLIILIVAAGCLAVYLGTRTTSPANVAMGWESDPEGNSKEVIEKRQETVSEQYIPGDEPPEPAEFSVRVEVDPTGEKNRLYYYIDESHGYFVETLVLWLWYVSEPGMERDDSPLTILVPINDFVRANQTYKGCIEVVPAELRNVSHNIGTDENWVGEIDNWGRVRDMDPDPLPAVAHAMSCD